MENNKKNDEWWHIKRTVLSLDTGVQDVIPLFVYSTLYTDVTPHHCLLLFLTTSVSVSLPTVLQDNSRGLLQHINSTSVFLSLDLNRWLQVILSQVRGRPLSPLGYMSPVVSLQDKSDFSTLSEEGRRTTLWTGSQASKRRKSRVLTEVWDTSSMLGATLGKTASPLLLYLPKMSLFQNCPKLSLSSKNHVPWPETAKLFSISSLFPAE